MTVTSSSIDNNGAGVGGGIENEGTLTVTDSTIDNNDADAGTGGGGIANESGSTLMVTNSSIAKNESIYGGGGIVNFGTVTVTNSSIDYNTAGGIANVGMMTVTGSTIDNNGAGSITISGIIPGIENGGGGMTVTSSTIANNGADGIDNGPLTVTDSTIANNGGYGVRGGDTSITNSTIANNHGGGLDTLGKGAILYNTIVAMNGFGATGSDIAGSVSSSSAYNLIGTGGSGGLTDGVNGNQVGVADPGLGPLAYYGGPTQTIALLPGSPAIDMGSNALAVDPSTGQPLTTDQRGTGFLRIVNGTIDIGAYEFLPAASDAVAVGWGTQTASLQTADDGLRLLPAGRNTDLPWLGIDQLQITLGQAQTLTPTDVTVASAMGVNYGPVTVSGSGTSYTITLAQPIDAADRVTITIVNPGISLFNRRVDVLPGDFNDDGLVNSQDLVGVRNEILGVAPVTIFGDLNGDGMVDINDYNAVRQRIGTTLPPLT
jgi:Dockerin type I domain